MTSDFTSAIFRLKLLFEPKIVGEKIVSLLNDISDRYETLATKDSNAVVILFLDLEIRVYYYDFSPSLGC